MATAAKAYSCHFEGHGDSSKGLQLSFSGVMETAAKAYSCHFQGLRRQQQRPTAVIFRGYGDSSKGLLLSESTVVEDAQLAVRQDIKAELILV